MTIARGLASGRTAAVRPSDVRRQAVLAGNTGRGSGGCRDAGGLVSVLRGLFVTDTWRGSERREGGSMVRYDRVVVKLSGEALAGEAGSGADPASLSRVADEVLSVRDLGVEVAVVVGGGNFFRGRMAEGWGISRAEADNIGMLGTIMNCLMLRGALTARTDIDIRVMTAVPMQSVAEPFIRLRAVRHLEHGSIVLLAGGIGQPYVTTDYPAVQRALELEADALLVAKRGVDGVYDSDPNHNPDAVRYENLTYDEALAAGVRVMDTSAFVLANEQSLTMHVFDVAAVGVMRQICEGANLGTRISAKG
jgi:uridylate kinase